jgi:hypothetical protein
MQEKNSQLLIFVFIGIVFILKLIAQNESDKETAMSSPLKREPQTLAERLFLVRNEHGLTWGQVAQLLGVEARGVAAYEQGHPVAQRILVTFADVFAVQWDWLLFGSGQRYTAATLLHATDTLHL